MTSSGSTGIAPQQAIVGFKGYYKFLANDARTAFVFSTKNHDIKLFDGTEISDIVSTAEHAYHAMKACNQYDAGLILGLPHADQPRRNGRQMSLRPDWRDIRLEVMECVLRDKFTLGAGSSGWGMKLVATADLELVNETKFKTNLFWGTHNGKGENNLGKLLMQIREELKSYLPVDWSKYQEPYISTAKYGMRNNGIH